MEGGVPKNFTESQTRQSQTSPKNKHGFKVDSQPWIHIQTVDQVREKATSAENHSVRHLLATKGLRLS